MSNSTTSALIAVSTDQNTGFVTTGRVVKELKTVVHVEWFGRQGLVESVSRRAKDVEFVSMDAVRESALSEDAFISASAAADAREFARAWDDAHRENEDRDGVVRPIHHLIRGYRTRVSCGATDVYRADMHEWASKTTCQACLDADARERAEWAAETVERDHAEALAVESERQMQAWRQRMVDRDHAEALEEDAARTVACSSIFAAVRMIGERVPTGEARCTAASGWLDEHLFEHEGIQLDPEGYDEYGRCGQPADAPVHIEGAHAWALGIQATRARLAQTEALGFIGRVKDARDAALRAGQPIGIIEGMQAVRDEDHDRALADDRRRQQHSEARATAAAGFRHAVRAIRRDRADGFSDPLSYRNYREAMGFYAQAVRSCDRLLSSI